MPCSRGKERLTRNRLLNRGAMTTSDADNHAARRLLINSLCGSGGVWVGLVCSGGLGVLFSVVVAVGGVWVGLCSGVLGVQVVGLSVYRLFSCVSPRFTRRVRFTAAALVVSHCRLRSTPLWGTRLQWPRLSQAMLRSTMGLCRR